MTSSSLVTGGAVYWAYTRESAESGATTVPCGQMILTCGSPASANLRAFFNFCRKIYLNLSSNDYLGLSQQGALKEAVAAAIEKWRIWSGASRLITGNHQLYECLEEKVARFKNIDASLIFSSCYMANIGMLSSLLQKGDRVFPDELNHASIIDGIRMSKARVYIYRHGDTEHLEELISASSEEGRPVIVTDTVFSMDGDIAPLDILAAIRGGVTVSWWWTRPMSQVCWAEEASGRLNFSRWKKDIDVTVGTFSKALGSYGAYVAGSRELIDFLTNRARSLIYTTALPPAVLAANIASLEVITQDPGLRERLKSNAAFLSQGLSGMGFRILPSQTAILPLMAGRDQQAVDIGGKLFQEGIIAKPILPPTVPAGSARIWKDYTPQKNLKTETSGKYLDGVSSLWTNVHGHVPAETERRRHYILQSNCLDIQGTHSYT